MARDALHNSLGHDEISKCKPDCSHRMSSVTGYTLKKREWNHAARVKRSRTTRTPGAVFNEDVKIRTRPDVFAEYSIGIATMLPHATEL